MVQLPQEHFELLFSMDPDSKLIVNKLPPHLRQCYLGPKELVLKLSHKLISVRRKQ